MLCYLLLANRRGKALPAPLLAECSRDDHPGLFFAPTSHHVWTNPSSSIAVAAWERSLPKTDVGTSCFLDSAEGITAYSGRIWPKGRSLPEQHEFMRVLSQDLEAEGAAGLHAGWNGVYTLLHLARNGKGFLVSDALGAGVIYGASVGRVVALSNRASLTAAALAALTGTPTARDPEAVGWLPAFGYIVGDSTGHRGVRALPHGTSVEVDASRRSPIRFVSSGAHGDDQPADYEALVESTLEDLVENMRAIARLPGSKSCDLTGGKDSRLILSLILAADVQDRFEFFTIGLPNSPDRQIATQIADRYGLDYKVSEGGAYKDDAEALAHRLRVHVFRTSGMLPAASPRAETNASAKIKIHGGFGELMRSPIVKSGGIRDRDHVRKIFDKMVDRAGLCEPQVRAGYFAKVESALDELDRSGRPPSDVPHAFYLRHRVHRWLGGVEEINASRPRYYPLQSERAMLAAARLGHDVRHMERLHFELMRRSCDALAKEPFAERGWSAEVYSDLPNARDYENPPLTQPPTAVTRWQEQAWHDHRDVFRRGLTGDRGNPIWDVLSYDAVSALIESDEPIHSAHVNQAFDALGSALWLAGSEEEARIGEPS